MIRVLLADDHPYVRTGIRNILQKTSDIIVVGEAVDGYQALRLVTELDPDVLVLDMEMPGIKGFEVAQQLNASGSDLPVLALSAHEDKQYILGMFSEGASGYLTKDEAPDTIVKAVRGVANGERGWVSQRIAARLAVWLKREKPEMIDLSDEELELLRLILAGKSPEQLSIKLVKSRREVDENLEKMMDKIHKGLEELFA